MKDKSSLSYKMYILSTCTLHFKTVKIYTLSWTTQQEETCGTTYVDIASLKKKLRASLLPVLLQVSSMCTKRILSTEILNLKTQLLSLMDTSALPISESLGFGGKTMPKTHQELQAIWLQKLCAVRITTARLITLQLVLLHTSACSDADHTSVNPERKFVTISFPNKFK